MIHLRIRKVTSTNQEANATTDEYPATEQQANPNDACRLSGNQARPRFVACTVLCSRL